MKVYPIALAPSIRKGGKTVFTLPTSKVSLSIPSAVIKDILRVSDGLTEMSEIITKLEKKWDKDSIKNVMCQLLAKGVLVNSHDLSKMFTLFSGNPSQFFEDLSHAQVVNLVKRRQRKKIASGKTFTVDLKNPLLITLNERQSVRVFSPTGSIEEKALIRLLWASYGITEKTFSIEATELSRRTVPSAGALYPLQISLILLKDVGEISKGVYSIDYSVDGAVSIKKEAGDDAIYASFVDPSVLEHAIGVIVISGSYRASAQKYANRSLLYVPLEAGHCAQNIHLSAHTMMISTVEIGGFIEETLSSALHLKKDAIPFTTVVFGIESRENPVENRLDLEIEWKYRITEEYQLPFHLCFTRMPSWKKDDWACGRSKNSEIAYQKAISEVIEWDAFKNPGKLDVARIGDFEKRDVCHPVDIVSYHFSQYEKKTFPLHSFDNTARYSWSIMEDVLAARHQYVLADHLFYPYEPSHKRYTFANSSGCATERTRGAALKNALYELVERDAFMIAWLNRLQGKSIPIQTLPRAIQLRIRELGKIGFTVDVKLLNFGFDVIFIGAYNAKVPFLTCAAAAGEYADQSLDKALMEVESAIFCQLQDKRRVLFKPSQVEFPEDHGNLYLNRRAIEHALFLVRPSSQTIKWSILEQKDRGEIISELLRNGFKKILVFDCNNIPHGRYVVRAIVPGLVPISFGYGLEPLGMERAFKVPFSNINRFPHPFN